MWLYKYYSFELWHKNYTSFSLKPLFSNLTFVYFWEVVSHHLHMLPQYHQYHLHQASLFASHLCNLPHILTQVHLIPQLNYHLWCNVSFDTISNDVEVYSIHHLTWVPWRSWAILGNTPVHCLSSHRQTFWDAFPFLHDTWVLYDDCIMPLLVSLVACLDLQVFLPHFFGVFIN